MSLLYTKNNKNVMFDDYNLYNGATDTSSENGKTLDGFEIADVYVCPHCVKKHNLYDECYTNEKEIDDLIEWHNEQNHDACSYVCGIKGCTNEDSLDGTLILSFCKVID